jgi:putative NADH-flavin reductase
MRLLVLGATGGVGLELVRQAIQQGHTVTALVRDSQRLQPFAGRIQVVPGDLLNPSELATALQGHEAVVSGFGPRLPLSKSDHDLLQRFAATLTDAMSRAHVNRAVIISTAFLFKNAVLPPVYLLGRLLFPSVVADASAMEDMVMRSALDWTLVRPPQLTDLPPTGKYRVREGHLPVFGFKLSRADAAGCMLRAIGDHNSIRKVIGVAN